jgi:hypothetical protein
MMEVPGNSYPVEKLNAEAFQKAKEQNLAEFDRRSLTRIYTVEQTRKYPTALEISYGDVVQELPIEAYEKVKPGTKILVVQLSEDAFSPTKDVYALGENLKEKSSSS